MVRKIGIIVQAHMGSSRLPNKMLKDRCGKTVLGHVISRLQRVRNADALIIATSTLPADDAIVEECRKYHVDAFRGSNEDVLSRFYHAAVEYELTDIARVCADNTLIDWNVIDDEIAAYRTGKYERIDSSENVPLGLGCEIFSFDMLKEAYENANEHYQHEHVTPYLDENYAPPYRPPYPNDYSKYRFTLDTEQDWKLIQNIYHALYREGEDMTLDRVVTLMEENPHWFDINKDVHQKLVKE